MQAPLHPTKPLEANRLRPGVPRGRHAAAAGMGAEMGTRMGTGRSCAASFCQSARST